MAYKINKDIKVKPLIETTCSKQSTALKDHCFDTINLIEPAFKDHLLYETNLITSLRWSLNTGFTVPSNPM